MLLSSDPDLLRRFRAGEHAAMSQVFRHYGERLARYLAAGFTFQSQGELRRFAGVRDRFELHDLCAECFRRAFEPRAREAYDGRHPYEQFLRSVARNLVVDRLRSERTQAAQDPAWTAAHQGEPMLSAQEKLEQAELGQMVAAFENELGADERQLVALRFVEGLSQRDAAEKMERSRRWVRDTELELRQRLVKQLRGSGYLPATAHQPPVIR
jgi:RNA polymerase sigma-70 factor (ECF subfamily)